MDIQTIVSYLDIAFIAILVLGGLIGFKRGIFKSTYSLIVFVVLITFGWILSKSFVNVILDASVNLHTNTLAVNPLTANRQVSVGGKKAKEFSLTITSEPFWLIG